VAPHDFNSATVLALRQQLLAFYAKEARDLPWRHTNDAYKIWISEIMLQQTQVATVRERYERFLARFPDVRSLAAAGVDAVCEEWAGLGYYSRAKNLHAAACQVSRDHAGRLPTLATELQSLPGIGRYTAGAISSIAYGKPAAAVDANAERVLTRLFAIRNAPGRTRSERLWAIAGELAATPDAGRVNQALMDIAASYCRPKAPRCDECPLERNCLAGARREAEGYPVKKEKPPRQRLSAAMLWIERDDGRLLLEQRPATGLWAGQWQLPCEEGDDAAARLAERMDCRVLETNIEVRHLLTHREVIAQLFRGAQFFDRKAARTQWTSTPRSAPVNALSRKAIELMLPGCDGTPL
jgi:A/G-specific adenine glycosylase